MTMRIEAGGATTVGARKNNEDALLSLPEHGVFAVADGMGGYEGGEVASRLVVDSLAEFFRREASGPTRAATGRDAGASFVEGLLDVAVRLAHRRVRQRQVGRLAEMGTTVAALVLRDGLAVIGHVGDSRVYRVRGGRIEQLTEDHSLYTMLASQAVAGLPPRAEHPYAHIVTRAIGASDDGRPELRCERALPGDVFLLATDGLEPLEPSRIVALLAFEPPQRACERLVAEAVARGSRDNVTAVVAQVIDA